MRPTLGPAVPLAAVLVVLVVLVTMGEPVGAGGFGEAVQPLSPTSRAVPMLTLPVSPVTNTYDWSGGHGGLEFGDAEGRALDGPQKINGSLAGAHLGYRIQSRHFVFGGEIAYADADLPISTSQVEFVQRRGLQAGYALGRVLPYLTAGQAITRTDEDNEDSIFFGDLGGYFYGAGVDVAVTNRLYVGAQYVAYDFDVEGFRFEADGASLRAGFRF